MSKPKCGWPWDKDKTHHTCKLDYGHDGPHLCSCGDRY